MFHRVVINVIFLIVCVHLENSGVFARTSKELRITLPNGNKLVGRVSRSHDGRPIRAFMGIPYAQPPIGELRFKAPVPIGKWQGELKANKDAPMCLQRGGDDAVGNEDCLYLNVFTPHRFNETLVNLPVMVNIHGGAFLGGSGMSFFAGPDYLLDHDVILVSGNYRLGTIGFLSSGTEDCPGNFGLKDQVQTLRWIKENIVAFGGDPNSVTIFGESAGGASVAYLLTSPLTEGLITRAIAQSGTDFDAWALPPHGDVAAKRAEKVAELVNCSHSGDWSVTINCLRGASALRIAAAINDFFVWDIDPVAPFPPVVEPDLPGAFITENPFRRQTQKEISIPLMTGITHDEGCMRSAPFLYKPHLFVDFADNLSIILPIALYYDHHSEAVQETITRKIIDFYFNNETLDRIKHAKNISDVFTDAWFFSGMDQYLQTRLLEKRTAPTFVYLFTYKGSSSSTEGAADPEKFYGVSHADEVQYIFPADKLIFTNALPTAEDSQMRKIMTELFVNFASTENPTPSTSELPKWHPSTAFPLDFYRIGNLYFDGKPMCGMESGGLFEKRAQFWRDLDAHSATRSEFKDEL